METAGARAARRSRLRADRLEASLRTLLGLAVLAAGVPGLMGSSVQVTLPNLSDAPEIEAVRRGSADEDGLSIANGLALSALPELAVISLASGSVEARGPGESCSSGHVGALTPDGKWAAISCREPSAYLWSVTEGGELVRLSHEAEVWAIASRGNTEVVIGDRQGHVIRWSVPDGKKLAEMHQGRWIFSLAVSPTSGRVALIDDHQLRYWDGENLYGAKPLSEAEDFHDGLAWSDDGRWLAAARGQELLLYDGLTGAPAGEPIAIGVRGDRIVFSPDGALIAVGGDDRWVVVFVDVASRRVLGEVELRWRQWLSMKESPAGAMEFTGPDELTVLTAHRGGLLRVKVPPRAR